MLMVVILLVTVVFLVLSTTKLNLHPFLALLFAAIGFGIVSGMPLSVVADSINEGFGGTIGKIGIVIIAGTIIGTLVVSHANDSFFWVVTQMSRSEPAKEVVAPVNI